VAALRCYFRPHCRDAATGIVATLRRCWKLATTFYATMASGNSARGNDKQPYAALQRWQATIIYLFIFFFSTISREQEKEKRQSFETCFPALLVGITQALSCNVNSFRQQQHQHPPATIARIAPVTLITLVVATIT